PLGADFLGAAIPHELAVLADREVLAAAAAERAAVERRIARVGLGERLAHRGARAAFQMDVGTAHRADEAFGALLLGQHDVALLLAVGSKLAMLRIDLGAVGQGAARILAHANVTLVAPVTACTASV